MACAPRTSDLGIATGRRLGYPYDGGHNLRAAELYDLADAWTSILAIEAFDAGKYPGTVWLDPAIGIVGALLIARWPSGPNADSRRRPNPPSFVPKYTKSRDTTRPGLRQRRTVLILRREDRLPVLAKWLSQMPASLKGALWMVTSGASVACMIVLVRFVASELHPFEIAFWRNAFSLAFTLPWLMPLGRAAYRTRQFRWQVFRSVVMLGSMLCWFSAVAWMPVAEATALSFTMPLFTTVGAALFLGERVRLRRWIVTLIGFAGTMIILRPGLEALSLPAMLALASAALGAPAVLAVKRLSRTDSTATIVFYMGLLGTPLSAVPALFVWTGPSVATVGWLAAIGATSVLSYFAFVRSLTVADASAVMPFDFSRLIFVAVLGYALFSETPDLWTWVGGAIVFAAALYSARREAQDEVAAPPATESGSSRRL